MHTDSGAACGRRVVTTLPVTNHLLGSRKIQARGLNRLAAQDSVVKIVILFVVVHKLV